MKKLCALALCLMMTPLAAVAMPMKWNDSFNFNAHSGNGGSKSQAFNINRIGFKSRTVVNYKPKINLRGNGRIVKLLTNRSNGRNSWNYNGGGRHGGGHNGGGKGKKCHYNRKHCKPVDVPEPGSLALLGLGLVGLGLARRRLSSKS